GPTPATGCSGWCGQGWVCDTSVMACLPSMCWCGWDGWTCTEDCNPGICVPAEDPEPEPPFCSDWLPDIPCSVHSDCDAGLICDLNECWSDCWCDAEGWICTDECNPGLCVPVEEGPPDEPVDCPLPIHIGCSELTDCPAGQVCDHSEELCLPSSCECTEGDWLCTDDCLPGVCVPE
ncbi:MAG: hypothetical protein FWD57_11155, partial [Polyangiaceae bacterium]|nr:hypothetical protein [Polyangiaceae bacterium]